MDLLKGKLRSFGKETIPIAIDMRPMAINVPVTMLISMFVAFTLTPWMAYHVLKRKYGTGGTVHADHDPHNLDAVKQSRLYKLFYPLMAPLLRSRLVAWSFLIGMLLLTFGALGLAAFRGVPLKMLPFDNKNELLLVLNLDKGTTLERTDAAVRDFENYLATVPEVADYTSYVGLASPMDFNGLLRHYGQLVPLAELGRWESRGLQVEWARLRDDLDALEEMTVTTNGRSFVVRSQTEGDAGKALQAVGIAFGLAVRLN
jgi:multidrug efflux pump subunit AcrB